LYIKCINKKSKNGRCKKKLANMLIRQGRFEEAEKKVKALAEKKHKKLNIF